MRGGGILTVRRGRKFTRILESSLSFVLGIKGGDFDSKEGEEVYTYLRILSQFCSWY